MRESSASRWSASAWICWARIASAHASVTTPLRDTRIGIAPAAREPIAHQAVPRSAGPIPGAEAGMRGSRRAAGAGSRRRRRRALYGADTVAHLEDRDLP